MSDDATREDPGAPSPEPVPAEGVTAEPAATPAAELAAEPGSPVALLQALASALPPDAIDELWIFSPRRVGGAQSTVIVASAFEARARGPEEADNEAAPEPGDAGTGAPAVAPEEGPDLAGAESDRRRIITARFTVAGDPRSRLEVRHELAEHGAAPSARVGRVVDGVLRRLEDEPEPPRYARIAGDAARWSALLEELAQA